MLSGPWVSIPRIVVQAGSKTPAIHHAEGPKVGPVGVVSHFFLENVACWPGAPARTLIMYSFFLKKSETSPHQSHPGAGFQGGHRIERKLA
jgi:hypothetical protein